MSTNWELMSLSRGTYSLLHVPAHLPLLFFFDQKIFFREFTCLCLESTMDMKSDSPVAVRLHVSRSASRLEPGKVWEWELKVEEDSDAIIGRDFQYSYGRRLELSLQ